MKIYNTIDEYIANFQGEVKASLEQIRNIIHEMAPEATEKISYGIPTFVLNGNLIHFAGYEHHIGLYPGSGALDSFKEELKPYETSKGTIRFPIDKPLPEDLIRRIVLFRVGQILSKKK